IFSVDYTGKLSFEWNDFRQTCHFSGTQNVPFYIFTKKAGHFLSYFIYKKNRPCAFAQGLYLFPIFYESDDN
ncbi:MAG: hypothetical protein IKA89_06175, partial [Anaerotignum sp.]|nr:hypothetical protein [Anaerotignum sp.]